MHFLAPEIGGRISMGWRAAALQNMWCRKGANAARGRASPLLRAVVNPGRIALACAKSGRWPIIVKGVPNCGWMRDGSGMKGQPRSWVSNQGVGKLDGVSPPSACPESLTR